LSFWVLVKAEKRSDSQRSQLERLRARDARLGEAVGLLEGLAALVRKQPGTSLQQWQEAAARSGCAEVRRLAEGLKQDQAVEAALQQRWSNGPVEGQVNRLKTIKRQRYGRPSFEMLRRRVVHRG
jgi:transposase